MIDAIVAFIDRVIPGQRFALVGFSYGGYLARGVIARRAARIDGALLCVPQVTAVLDPARLPPQATIIADPILAQRLGPVADMVVMQTPVVADAVREIMTEVALADHAFQARLEAAGPATFERDEAASPVAPTLGAPTLIITARQDALCGYRDAWQLLERYPRATFAVLDAAGHFINVEQTALCHALTRDWLRRVGWHVMVSAATPR
jgi:pimeloyl-ACP methyl ester carboxylesterase